MVSTGTLIAGDNRVLDFSDRSALPQHRAKVQIRQRIDQIFMSFSLRYAYVEDVFEPVNKPLNDCSSESSGTY